MKLAQLLNLRKQVFSKVEQLRPLKVNGDAGVFATKVTRRPVSDQVDEATFTIPRITVEDITATYDHYATQLRKIDDAIQKANWDTEVDFKEEPYVKKASETVETK